MSQIFRTSEVSSQRRKRDWETWVVI